MLQYNAPIYLGMALHSNTSCFKWTTTVGGYKLELLV